MFCYFYPMIFLPIFMSKYKMWNTNLNDWLKIFFRFHFVFVYLPWVVFAWSLHHITTTVVFAFRSNSQEQFNVGVDYLDSSKSAKVMHDQLAIYCCRCNMSIKAKSLTSLLAKSEQSLGAKWEVQTEVTQSIEYDNHMDTLKWVHLWIILWYWLINS